MKFYYSTIFKCFLLIAISACAIGSIAQGTNNSVYSRFGLGTIDPPGSVPHFSMGGVTTPMSDPTILNYSNPASYSYLDITSLQVSAKGAFSKASTSEASSKFANGQMYEIGMGFKKPGSKWAYAIGLNPYSSVDYSFVTKQVLSDTLSATYNYTGNGGLNKVALGTSRLFKFYSYPRFRERASINSDSLITLKIDSLEKSIRLISKNSEKSDPIAATKRDSLQNLIDRLQKRKNEITGSLTTNRIDSLHKVVHQLSIGSNANYIFGNITRTNGIQYDNSNYYTTVNHVNVWSQGFVFEFGLLYKVNLSTHRDPQRRVTGGSLLQVGADYSLNSSLYAEYSEILYSIRRFTNYTLRDTAYSLDTEKGRLKIPQKISVGAAYKIYSKKLGSFTFAVDYKTQDWSKYRLAITSDAHLDKGLNSSSMLSAGFEYKPSTDISTNFLHRMNYRLGFRSSETALVLNNYRITQRGITAGLSIPVIKSMTKFHLGVEYGTTGTTEANLVKENYLSVMVGFTLTPSLFDRWFRQVKYD